MKYRVMAWNGSYRIEQYEPDEHWHCIGEFDNKSSAENFVKEIENGTLV